MILRCWLCIFALMVFYWTLPGCGKSGGNGPPGGDAKAGDPKILFDTHCGKCHAQAGEPGGPQQGNSKGPNLAHIGSKQGCDADWIAKYIRDPKSVRSDTKMPKFEGMIREEELRSLAEYLARQK